MMVFHFKNKIYSIIFIIITSVVISYILLNQTIFGDNLIYDSKQNAVVVYPIYTPAAYQKNGFYYYYNGTCNTKCLTVQISTSKPELASSAYGFEILNSLKYPHITDQDITNNPSILNKYNWVILLHNEYVTKQEYNAIISHDHIIFLYPNALYAMVADNGNSISLIKGHRYQGVSNAFGWKDDNHLQEYDWNCKDWKFKRIDKSSYQLNCFPELLITHPSFLKAIKTITLS